MRHGTLYAWRYKECRCKACEAAHEQQLMRQRARAHARRNGTLTATPRGTPVEQLKSHRGEGCIVSLRHRETGETRTLHRPDSTPLRALRAVVAPFNGDEWQLQAVSTIQTIWSDLRMHNTSSVLRSAEQLLLGKIGRTNLL